MIHRFVLLLLLFLTIGCPVSSKFVIEDFERNGVDNWVNLELSNEIKHSGNFSGCWYNTSSPTTVTMNLTNIKTDWSGYGLLSVWVYGKEVENTIYRVTVYSENASTSGKDYFGSTIRVNWKGWKEFKAMIPASFYRSGSPVGWDHLNKLLFYSVPEGVDDITQACITNLS